MTRRFFAMVHTRASADYTPHALSSFSEHTKMEDGDRFYMISNDDGFVSNGYRNRGLYGICNPQPKSFAANVNQILERAQVEKADVIFLNNDLIFTPGWLEPLLHGTGAIVSPLSNGQLPIPNFPPHMDLSDMEGKIPRPLAYVSVLPRTREAFWIPFFAIRIPYEVYSKVGMLDERFGKAGAEDVDYCIRTWLAGFRCEFRNHSWLVHFSGKSTWRGAETPQETMARDSKYRQEFVKKWGDVLTRAALDMKAVACLGNPGDYKGAIESMIQAGSSGAKE